LLFRKRIEQAKGFAFVPEADFLATLTICKNGRNVIERVHHQNKNVEGILRVFDNFEEQRSRFHSDGVDNTRAALPPSHRKEVLTQES